MKITRTIRIEGANATEYEAIKAHLEKLAAQFPGWTLNAEQLLNRVTATKTETVDTLT